MGGLIVAASLCERAPDVACAVTSGAALAVSDDLSRGRESSRRGCSGAWLRVWPWPPGWIRRGSRTIPEVVRAYVEDPLVFRRMTTSLAVELMGAIERTAVSCRSRCASRC